MFQLLEKMTSMWNVKQDQYKGSMKDNFFAFKVSDNFIHGLSFFKLSGV